MYHYQFPIDLELTDEQHDKLMLAFQAADNLSGIHDCFEDFLEDKIHFRLLRHIFKNVEIELDTLRHYDCQQT